MWGEIAGIVGIKRSFAKATANSGNSQQRIRGIRGRLLVMERRH
jgi:hypothetical protein